MAKKPRLQLFPEWRELLKEREDEAVAELGSIPGVKALIVGGSVGRGEPWPLSDIDIIPVIEEGANVGDEIERRVLGMVDLWTSSGRAQSLDVGGIRFTTTEVEEVLQKDVRFAAKRMTDRRWFFGIDKPYKGRCALDHNGIGAAFATWIDSVRFDPVVVASRVKQLWGRVRKSRVEIEGTRDSDDVVGETLATRSVAEALRQILLESWGTRVGSMSRNPTLFEHVAKEQGHRDIADSLSGLDGALVETAMLRAEEAPLWLRERIRLSFAARLEIGEQVTEAESARDQLTAFSILATRRKPRPWDAWVGVPDLTLADRRGEIDDLISLVSDLVRLGKRR